MGYELHIRRKKDFDDFEEESEINLDEWLAYVNQDRELELKNFFEAKLNDGTIIRHENIGFTIWTASNEENVWFDYYKGSIYAKNPSEKTIRKMMEIAESLGGKVQGDDGEIYNEEFLAEITKPRISETSNRRWWEFWK